jgi:2-polyprenyl-3-methyl-5-hydroxy-6-metoxy-1,4-benzoquinol methylase
MSPLAFLVDWNPRRDLDAVKVAGFKKGQSLLDVGCGQAAKLVHDLRALGYQAIGAEPFIEVDVEDEFGLSVLKKHVYDLDGQYDVVIFRHSLEHIPEPKKVLHKVRSLLAPGGTLIICVPVAAWAWRHYNTDWAQLDAPRHLCLYTEKAMALLAASAKFTVFHTVFDSDDFQFWGSEGLGKGLLLPQCAPPPGKEQRVLKQRAKALNQQRDGDQAQFFLKRSA